MTPPLAAASSARTRRPRLATALLLAAFATACGTESRDTTRNAPPGAAGAAGAAPTDSTGAPPEPACPPAPGWTACTVEKRLTDAGLVPMKQDAAAPEGVFPTQGVTYALGSAELHVYLFATSAERERAQSAIDTMRVAAPGQRGPWHSGPVLVAAHNLAAVLESENARLIERVQLALTAGLPASASTSPR